MAAVQANIESVITGLAEEAWIAFADDISTMFEVEIECRQIEVGIHTIEKIQKTFRKVSAFHTVESEGALSGNFLVGFDLSGLFTLSGVIVMLPPKRVKETAKRGTLEDAQSMSDAVGEVGNLLVGSWDRVFREEFEGHKHFRKADSYIGIPWDDPEKTIGISRTDQIHYIEYEMTLDEYSSFKCAVLFPVNFLEQKESSSLPKDNAQDVEAVVISPEQDAREEAADADIETIISEESAEIVPSEEIAGESTEAAGQAEGSDEQVPTEQEQATSVSEPAEISESPTEESIQVESEPTAIEDASTSQSSETIQSEEVDVTTAAHKDVSRPASAPIPTIIGGVSNGLTDILSLPVKEFMDIRVIWGSPNDSVQDMLAKMQQHDVGYTVIGEEGVLEGIISKSNILGAISPFLRPVFAKWHTPADDATLNIKIQWIMSRPVRSIGPETPLSVAVQTMQQFGGRCLPVVEQGGKVVGMLTVFDIFSVMTRNSQFSISGRTPQAPCLMI